MSLVLRKGSMQRLLNICRKSPAHFSICKRWISYNDGFVPRRSFLYLPGNDERKIRKATGLDADCVVLDCEDAVAANRKEEARNMIQLVLGKLDFGSSELCVRINSIGTGLAADDLKAILSGDTLPDTIVLPKVETVEHINWISEKIASCMKASGRTEKIGLITQVENPIGLINLNDVCKQGIVDDQPFRWQAIIFGSDDFLASIGGTRTKDAKELIFARQSIVTHAKAYGLQALDMVFIDYKDLEGLRVQSEEGARMGYTGKQIIHPGQISVVNKSFSPNKEKIEWAKNLLAAFEEQEKAGKGAISYQGNMIDMPTVLQARNVINLAEVMKKN